MLTRAQAVADLLKFGEVKEKTLQHLPEDTEEHTKLAKDKRAVIRRRALLLTSEAFLLQHAEAEAQKEEEERAKAARKAIAQEKGAKKAAKEKAKQQEAKRVRAEAEAQRSRKEQRDAAMACAQKRPDDDVRCRQCIISFYAYQEHVGEEVWQQCEGCDEFYCPECVHLVAEHEFGCKKVNRRLMKASESKMPASSSSSSAGESSGGSSGGSGGSNASANGIAGLGGAASVAPSSVAASIFDQPSKPGGKRKWKPIKVSNKSGEAGQGERGAARGPARERSTGLWEPSKRSKAKEKAPEADKENEEPAAMDVEPPGWGTSKS